MINHLHPIDKPPPDAGIFYVEGWPLTRHHEVRSLYPTAASGQKKRRPAHSGRLESNRKEVGATVEEIAPSDFYCTYPAAGVNQS